MQITKDGETLFCQCANHITIVEVETVSIRQTIPPNLHEFNSLEEDDVIDDPILTFALSHDEELVASGHKSGLIKLWKWKGSNIYCVLYLRCFKNKLLNAMIFRVRA